MQITKIPPRPAEPQKKLRVAAYCRVSTDYSDQLASLENQRTHYESYIRKNAEWELAGIYYDEGISGTKKDRRAALLQMIQDCEDQKIDRVLTKSISRFSRNTMECLEIVRYLTDLGVSLYFEKENIDTQSMDSELMLTILSSMAENESVSLSKNTKWGIKKRFQRGSYKLCKPTYGYDYKDGEMVVNDEEARIVQKIFDDVLSGKPAERIAQELAKDGIPTKKGGTWAGQTIRNMLINVHYTGSALFQKTYTDDQFVRRKNQGEQDMYLIEEHHEAIISKDVFEAVGSLLQMQRARRNIESGKYHKRYAFSGKLRCGVCGGNMKRRAETIRGEKRIFWACNQHIKDRTVCSLKSIRDEAISEAFVSMMNKLILTSDHIIKPLRQALRQRNPEAEAQKAESIQVEIDEILEKRQVLAKLMTKGLLNQEDYIMKNHELHQLEKSLRTQKDEVQERLLSLTNQLDEVAELHRFTAKGQQLEGFDGEIFQQFIEAVEVFSQTEFILRLKCGLKLKESVVK